MESAIILVTNYGMGFCKEPSTLPQLLFGKYLDVMLAGDDLPNAICFYTDGVKLVLGESPVLDRLKSLEQQGILTRRVLPPPAGSTVYELTPFGQALEKAVLELGRWGSRLLPASLEGVALPSVGAIALAIKAFYRPEQAKGINETYELHLDHEVLQATFRDDELRVQQGQALKADVVFYTDMAIFMGLFSGQIKPNNAISGGLIRIEGDPDALSRFLNLTGVALVSSRPK